MITKPFEDLQISMLAFGAMRLPQTADGKIDQAAVEEMTDYAMAHGVNYYDTAYPYHEGLSEGSICKALSKYPRSSYFLADKFPGHQIADTYYPEEIFEEQLKKCGVDYFDFYLLHNVYENSLDVYMDPKWGILPYFLEQKKNGRIKHLGFSCHGRPETMQRFLDYAGDEMEFCQIQLNYLDWTLQGADKKVELLNRYNIPIWVMEPVRGGRLCDLKEHNEKLKALRPDESIASWSFRWLQTVPGVTTVLSGMSNLEQMKDNIRTFSEGNPLSEEEKQMLVDLGQTMQDSVPCTGCRYCTEMCPMELNIPAMMMAYNDIHFGVEGGLTASMQMDALPADKMPAACLQCGACEQMCPQHIEISSYIAELRDTLETMPHWADLCKERAAAAAKLKE